MSIHAITLTKQNRKIQNQKEEEESITKTLENETQYKLYKPSPQIRTKDPKIFMK